MLDFDGENKILDKDARTTADGGSFEYHADSPCGMATISDTGCAIQSASGIPAKSSRE